ncbi:hypothetical protein F5B20DRAFT_520873 [Whalleya microplaca]|nr:hypothetical protein F5B20DRAFT_520873 [Whalleya microplaca]
MLSWRIMMIHPCLTRLLITLETTASGNGRSLLQIITVGSAPSEWDTQSTFVSHHVPPRTIHIRLVGRCANRAGFRHYLQLCGLERLERFSVTAWVVPVMHWFPIEALLGVLSVLV